MFRSFYYQIPPSDFVHFGNLNSALLLQSQSSTPPSGGGNPTGVSGAAAIGTIATLVSITLAGVAGTGAVSPVSGGTLFPTPQSVQATGQIGTISFAMSTNLPVTGVSAFADVGTPTVSIQNNTVTGGVWSVQGIGSGVWVRQ